MMLNLKVTLHVYTYTDEVRAERATILHILHFVKKMVFIGNVAVSLCLFFLYLTVFVTNMPGFVWCPRTF